MCGLAMTQLRAGAAWVFYGTTGYALRIAGCRKDSTTSTNGAYGGPDQVKPGRLMRYQDHSPAATRGIFHPAHIGTGP